MESQDLRLLPTPSASATIPEVNWRWTTWLKAVTKSGTMDPRPRRRQPLPIVSVPTYS